MPVKTSTRKRPAAVAVAVPKRPFPYPWLAAVLILLAVLRIASTWSTFSQTIDEPIHIACGVEWLERGTYLIEPQHPPLSRIAAGLGPYLAGARLSGERRSHLEGNQVLHTHGQYVRNLVLARLGNLPFFIAASVMIWLWGRRLLGDMPALLGLLVFTNTPPVLAHAGLATTDMACTAAFIAALWAFIEWLERPLRRPAVLLGMAGGIALLSKFSLIPYLGIAFAMSFSMYAWKHGAREWRARAKTAALALLIAFVVMWAGYRFSVGPLEDKSGKLGDKVHEFMRRTIPASVLPVLNSGFLPAPELLRGIMQVGQHNEEGHVGYVLGQSRSRGIWYFFPVALSVKTPLAFAALAIAGLVLVLRSRSDWRLLALALAGAVILVFAMSSRINIGVRHVLPLYGLMALFSAAAVTRLFQSPVRWRWAAAGLLAVQVIAVAAKHPDYLSYFNLLAGRSPEKILVDSDLDWGQDLFRLRDKLKELGADRVALAYFGSADVLRHGLPNPYPIRPGERPSGFVAVSLWVTHVAKDFSWLYFESERPVATAGDTIRIYYIQPMPIPIR